MFNHSHTEAVTEAINRIRPELLKHIDLDTLEKPVDYGNSLLEFHGAFELIKDKTNFKMPILAIINKDDYAICAAACSHFTGSTLDIVEEHSNQTVTVQSVGYYESIGS